MSCFIWCQTFVSFSISGAEPQRWIKIMAIVEIKKSWQTVNETEMCSSLQAEEEKCGDSIHHAHILTGGPRFTQWGTKHWAGYCYYWTLVHGTRRTESRNSAEWTCRNLVFTTRWAQKSKHSHIIRLGWKPCILLTAPSVKDILPEVSP